MLGGTSRYDRGELVHTVDGRVVRGAWRTGTVRVPLTAGTTDVRLAPR